LNFVRHAGRDSASVESVSRHSVVASCRSGVVSYGVVSYGVVS
jgi:hypothetical protein